MEGRVGGWMDLIGAQVNVWIDRQDGGTRCCFCSKIWPSLCHLTWTYSFHPHDQFALPHEDGGDNCEVASALPLAPDLIFLRGALTAPFRNVTEDLQSRVWGMGSAPVLCPNA